MPDLSGSTHRFQFTLANELIAFHGSGHFIPIGGDGVRTAENFAEAANADGRITVPMQRDQILNPAAYFDIGGRKETNAAGTDVPGLLYPVDAFVTKLEDLHRQL